MLEPTWSFSVVLGPVDMAALWRDDAAALIVTGLD